MAGDPDGANDRAGPDDGELSVSGPIRSTTDGDVVTVLIDRPDNGNRVTNAMAAELGDTDFASNLLANVLASR